MRIVYTLRRKSEGLLKLVSIESTFKGCLNTAKALIDNTNKDRQEKDYLITKEERRWVSDILDKDG